MKKLLTLLSGLTFISTTSLGVISCKQNKITSINPTAEVDDEKEQKEKEKKELENQEKNFNDKINFYSKTNPMILENENYNDVKADDVIKKLYDDQFMDIKDDLVILPANFEKIVVDEAGQWKAHGHLQLTAKFKGHDLKNVKIAGQENTIFAVYFTTNALHIKEVEIIKENIINLDSNTENLNVSLFEQTPAFTNILKLLTNVNNLGSLPTIIPTEFNENDPHWKQWNEFVNNLKLSSDFSSLLGENCKESTFSGEQTIMKGFLIKYQGKYLDVLNALLPNIINFNNFVQQQKEINNSDNKLFLLGKYLFAKPQNINNDGFLDVNRNVKNKAIKNGSNKDELFLKFNTNLESLFHNILEGWQNKKGEWSFVSEPLLLETLGQGINIGKVKYNKPAEESGSETKISYGITELFEIERIKNSFSNLFTKSLNKDWTITITIPKAIFGNQDHYVDFTILSNATVNSLLAEAIFKKLDLINSESIAISATFTEEMIFEYLDKTTKEWKKN